MVGELTVGKKRYADVEEDIRGLMERSQALRLRFLELVDGDAEAFAPLAKAYGIPKDDPDRAEIMENALKTACSVPMDIMRACAEALDIIEEFAAKGLPRRAPRSPSPTRAAARSCARQLCRRPPSMFSSTRSQ